MTLTELAEAYGTPLYVYRLDAVRAAADALVEALPAGVRLFYSLKANPHPRIVATLADRGLGLEISSAGELAAARAARDVLPATLYTGPGQSAGEAVAAVRAGVRLFSVESRTARDRLAAAAPGPVEVLVRLNPQAPAGPAGLRMTGGPSPFGVDPAILDRDAGLLAPMGPVRPVGFHAFTATNLPTEDAVIAELCANVDATAAASRRAGFAPELVDLGGGFGAPYMTPGQLPRFPRLRAELVRKLDATFAGWRDGAPAIAVESGRYLAAACGTLLTTVMDVKSSGPHTYLVCDAGVNVLGGMYGTGRLVGPKAQPDGQPQDAPTGVLVGPLCTPLDVLSRGARVATPRVGQVLAVPNVGAYGLTASLVAFLGRPIAAEVVLDGTGVVDARRLALRPEPLDTGVDRSDPTLARRAGAAPTTT